MAKAASAKKATSKSNAKNPAAYASTEKNILPSQKNPSKISPTNEVISDEPQTDPQTGLLKLLISCVKDIYWAEKQLTKALPKMARSAADADLADAILQHLEETKVQVERLEQVFELLDQKPQAKKCEAMEGLTKEGESVVEETDEGTPARDIGIILSSQKVEHYEIAAYTGIINLSNKLGRSDVADILAESLEEEQNSDAKLAEIADSISNA